jgi:hypothetical protein
MKQVSSLVVLSAVLTFAAVPGRAAADPIQIEEGRLDMVGLGGTVSLAAAGFAFTGGVVVTGGVFGPWTSCLPCNPGDSISLGAFWGGNDLHGTAIFNGVTYEQVGSLMPGRAFGSVTFTGSSLIAPGAGLTATVTGPFTFQGEFFFPATGGFPSSSASLLGSGTATIQLARSVEDIGWAYRAAVYEFDQGPAPIPEPGTWLLVSSALAGLAARRRRMRHHHASDADGRPVCAS